MRFLVFENPKKPQKGNPIMTFSYVSPGGWGENMNRITVYLRAVFWSKIVDFGYFHTTLIFDFCNSRE